MRAIAKKISISHAIAFVISSTYALVALAPALAAEPVPAATPRAEGWLLKSFSDIAVQPPPKSVRGEQAELEKHIAKRTADDLARYYWWSTGGPVHRWNELMLEEMQESFVVLPAAARHLALFHVALDDAVAAARHHGGRAASGRPIGIDAAIDPKRSERARIVAPSEHAAAAAAAAEVMAYLFPARAAHFTAKAEQAIQTRLLAGAELPYEVAVGRAIGTKVAAMAITRGKSDRSDAKWTGTVPEGVGKWKGTNPIAPAAANWQTWVLDSPSEFRPAPPPAVESDQVKAALAELKNFPRTPKTNHRAIYWEVHGGARAHTLWNEIARTKLLEHGYTSSTASRIMAAVNVALADAGIACWDAKFAFWYVRPPQLDPELKSLFAPPNHPSYPAAHGCFSTAAATVLARVFPRDADRLLGLGKEAAEARVWAGIHFRFDIGAGQEIGRKVAEKTLARAFVAPTN